MLPDLDFPLAYHLTFGMYGTRLHGDERGTIDRRMNEPGDPIIGRNESWEQMERRHLSFAPVTLEEAQRELAKRAIPALCRRGGWQYHLAAVRSNHVHVLLTARVEGKRIRRWFKTWLGQALTEAYPHEIGRPWWADGGSVRWVWKQWYYETVYQYIAEQRTLRG